MGSIERPLQERGNNRDNNESVSASSEEELADPKPNSTTNQGNAENNSCACQRLTIHVLDISKVLYLILYKKYDANLNHNCHPQNV